MSREVGDVLEDYVFETWAAHISREANSGAKYAENDLRTAQHSIECKRKLSTKTLSLSGEELTKCIKRAEKSLREPAWVVETVLGRFVVVRYDDYCSTLDEASDHG